MQRLLVVVLGPTASGKSAAAITLAGHFKTIILSADSRQFYREIPVGTAQVKAEEQQHIPHYFIADRSVSETCDAGRYAREAKALLDTQFENHPVILMAGGSGLYIDAVVNGFDDLPDTDPSVREELRRMYEEQGIEALQQELLRLDPVYYAQVDLNNHARLMRAIEVCRSSGKPYSALRSGKKTELHCDVLKIGMEIPRETLYRRIDERVDRMMEAGLEAEARTVYPLRHLNALQTVGYSELFDYFEGRTDLRRAVELIKQHSRNYAKRQMTWWRRDPDIQWFAPDDIAGMLRVIEAKIAGKEAV